MNQAVKLLVLTVLLSFYSADALAKRKLKVESEMAQFQAYRPENKKTEFKIRVGSQSTQGVLNIFWSEDSIKGLLIQTSLFSQKLDVNGDWTNLGSKADRRRKNIVRCVDLNFDGVPDLLIETSSGSAGQTFRAFIYSLKKRKFVVQKDFETLDVWNPRVDFKNKFILSKPNDVKKTWAYHWVKGRLKVVKSKPSKSKPAQTSPKKKRKAS